MKGRCVFGELPLSVAVTNFTHLVIPADGLCAPLSPRALKPAPKPFR